MICKYRKINNEVEAVQYNGHNWLECCRFIYGDPSFLDQNKNDESAFILETEDGTITPKIGTYIVKNLDSDGSFYFYMPEAFEKQFELIDTSTKK